MKQVKNLLVAGSALAVTAFSAVSFAAVDADVIAELTSAKADVATIGSLVLVVLVAAAVFKYIRRAM